MKPVAAGKLRERIEIQSRSAAQDDFGDSTNTWTTLATRWGSIEPLAGRELWQAAQVRPDTTHRVRLRYYPGLTPKHRLKQGSRIYQIDSVLNTEEARRLTECLCREEV